jgi:hypothetical protein
MAFLIENENQSQIQLGAREISFSAGEQSGHTGGRSPRLALPAAQTIWESRTAKTI